MVGDSTEDVECGNAAGTATCLIAGGGNETGAAAAPPPGAVPTFAVESLHELQRRLIQRDTALGWGAGGADSDSDAEPGAPPLGLDFLDALFAAGAVEGAACSFPRIDAARFGVPGDAHPGSRVLHLQCGTGALTKLLFSAGLLVVGADREAGAAARRGLPAVAVPRLDAPGALAPAAALGGAFDAAVLYGAAAAGAEALEARLWSAAGLEEGSAVLRTGGKLAAEWEAGPEGAAAAAAALRAAGFAVEVQEAVAPRAGGAPRARVIATKR
jgi:hypothetical protein